MEKVALSVCRQRDSRVAPTRFVLSLNVNGLVSHDEISAKYKGQLWLRGSLVSRPFVSAALKAFQESGRSVCPLTVCC